MNGRRQRIAREAARLLLAGGEPDVQRARETAARLLARRDEHPGGRGSQPSPAEIRREIEAMLLRREVHEHEGLLHDVRLQALRLMRALRRFDPQLSGGALDGGAAEGAVSLVELHARRDSDSNLAEATERLVAIGQEHTVFPGGSIEVPGRAVFRLRFRPTETSGARGAMGLPELERFLAREYPWHRFHGPEVEDRAVSPDDRFATWRALLEPLADVKQDPRKHPEGDALFHGLQVFQLVSRELPYDVDLCAAALLHPVGRALDARSWREATIEVLEDCVSERTLLFLRHLPDACAEVAGSLGGRARQRLRQLEDREELLLLARCDLRGRQAGASVPELDEALDFLRELMSYEEQP